MKIVAFISLLLFGYQISAQVINSYAKVTSITSSSNSSTLGVSSVTGIATSTTSGTTIAAHNFIVGEYVILMQMQDAVSYTTTTTGNYSSYGNLSTNGIGSAGLYEIRKILSIDGDAVVGTTATSSTAEIGLDLVINNYNFNANSAVQLITFRRMPTANWSSPNSTTAMTALAWDGSIGGVFAMEVTGTLTLQNDINVNGKGFRGGLPSIINDPNSSGWINPNTNSSNQGFKGEGIFGSPNNTNGFARILTGGGGGSSNGAGGGGGGNFSAGGQGDGTNSDDGAGYGGCALSAVLLASNTRAFLGGGGGGGQNRVGTAGAGGNGGGIIILKAGSILDPCPRENIFANGITGTASNQDTDGSGGGGAGGSIVLDIAVWSISPSTCSGDDNLDINANGGSGGNNSQGGGGGGEGEIIFTTISSNPSAVSPNITAGSGPSGANSGTSVTGTSPANIIFNNSTPLPVQLTFFNALLLENETVQLAWQTAAEINSAHFTVERSLDGTNWEEVRKVKAAGNSSEELNYSILDKRPYDGVSYYRLLQTDLDGQTKDWGIRSIIRNGEEIIVFPNPAENRIEFQGPIGSFEYVALYDLMGNIVTSLVTFDLITERQLTLNIDQLESGIYFLKTKDEMVRFVKK